MTCVVIATDEAVLGRMMDVVEKCFENDTVTAFINPLMAIKYCCLNKIDIAFITPELIRVDGIGFGAKLRERYPDVKLYFTTDDSETWECYKPSYECVRISSGITEDGLRELLRQNEMEGVV